MSISGWERRAKISITLDAPSATGLNDSEYELACYLPMVCAENMAAVIEKKKVKANYSITHQEGDAVSGLTMLSCGNALRQQWMSTCKAGGGEGLPRPRVRGGKRRCTHTPPPLHRWCPALSAAVRQQKPIPARNGISFQYRKKAIRNKNNLLYTVYLNQQSNIH